MSLTATPIQVVAALIFRDARVLVCQRNESGAFPLKWEFPGGKVEDSESDLDALERELREELGIVLREAVQVFEQEYVYPNGPAVYLRFFRVRNYEGILQNLVFRRIEWVDLAQLERLDFLEADRPLIQHLVAHGSSGLL